MKVEEILNRITEIINHAVATEEWITAHESVGEVKEIEFVVNGLTRLHFDISYDLKKKDSKA